MRTGINLVEARAGEVRADTILINAKLYKTRKKQSIRVRKGHSAQNFGGSDAYNIRYEHLANSHTTDKIPLHQQISCSLFEIGKSVEKVESISLELLCVGDASHMHDGENKTIAE